MRRRSQNWQATTVTTTTNDNERYMCFRFVAPNGRCDVQCLRLTSIPSNRVLRARCIDGLIEPANCDAKVTAISATVRKVNVTDVVVVESL